MKSFVNSVIGVALLAGFCSGVCKPHAPPISVPAPVATIDLAPVSQDDSPTVAEQDAGSGAVDSSEGAANREASYTEAEHRTPPTVAYDASPLAEQMLAASNRLSGQQRTLEPALCRAAQWYAELLTRTRQEGHYAYGGPEYRARLFGFTGSLLFNERAGNWYFDGMTQKREVVHSIGECTAHRCQNANDAFQGWLDSPKHREALMEPTFDVIGFGHSGTNYVMMLGNTKKEAAPLRAANGIRMDSKGVLDTRIIPQSCPSGQCSPGFRYVPQQTQRRGLFGRR